MPEDRVFGLQTEPDILWDELPEEKKQRKKPRQSFWAKVDSEVYDEMIAVVHDPRTAFTEINDFVTAAIVGLVDYYKDFLSADRRAMLYNLKEQQMRLSNERYAVTIEEHIETQLGSLRAWTADKEWGAVLASLVFWAMRIDDYPVREWRSRTARAWTQSKGVQQLRVIWKEEMEPGQRQQMDAIFEHWSRLV